MDERKVKRLLVMMVAAIVVIMLSKYMLTKTYTTLNKAAAVKKQAGAPTSTPDAKIPEVNAVPAGNASTSEEAAQQP